MTMTLMTTAQKKALMAAALALSLTAVFEVLRQDDTSPAFVPLAERTPEDVISYANKKLTTLIADDKANMNRSFSNQALREDLAKQLVLYSETGKEEDRVTLAVMASYTGKQYDCMATKQATAKAASASPVTIATECLGDFTPEQLNW